VAPGEGGSKRSLRAPLASWWNATPDDWLLEFLESRGVLVWLRRGIAGAGGGFAVLLALALCSPAGPQHPVARSVAAALIVLGLGRMLWWLFRPWPTATQARWSIGAADVVIALACWLNATPLFGLASTSVFLLPGAYLTFFHGAKAQTAHVAWVVLITVSLAIAVGVAPGQSGGWALAAAMALICLAVSIGILPVLQLGFWLIRRNAADSLVDPLTGLANRRGLDHQLDRLPARSGRGSMCVFSIDLDQFKAVNDRHGHAAGDDVLIQTADRIRAAMGSGALTARTGGEEFVVVGLLEPSSVRPLAERIRDAIAGETDPSVTASIGVAVTTAHDLPRDREISRVLRCADAAMYEAKHQGGNTVTIHACAAYSEACGRSPGSRRDATLSNPITAATPRLRYPFDPTG
jgi:diguanylate cyclase (GGDEF)-like protein